MPTPRKKIIATVTPAYSPCVEFTRSCNSMRWDPPTGHLPRGFCGATGNILEVKLVLVCAEPGDPHPNELNRSPDSAEQAFGRVYNYAYECFKSGTDQFHTNVRRILDLCFPNESFAQQMRKTWITDSVLCSAKHEGGSVPVAVSRACRSRYLEAQLKLFPNAIVVALGTKAKNRLKGLPGLLCAYAAAPPGANRKEAIESWKKVANHVRKNSA